MNQNTVRAIRNHTAEGCIKAYILNRRQGEGASTIALEYCIPGVRTTRQADAAINAGEELMKARSSLVATIVGQIERAR